MEPVTVAWSSSYIQSRTPSNVAKNTELSELVLSSNIPHDRINCTVPASSSSVDRYILACLENMSFGWMLSTVKCHYNACHYNANASLTRSILGSQTAPTCPHDHPRVAQHMVYRCEIIAVWSATAAMTPLCSHTNGMKQRHPTCWLCQCSRFMIDLRSNTLIIHRRCSENAINRPVWLTDARMLKTISVAIKLT